MSFLKGRMKRDESGSSLEETRWLGIDTELTGLEVRKDPGVSIEAVRMEGGSIGRATLSNMRFL